MRADEPDSAGRCAMQHVADWLEKLVSGNTPSALPRTELISMLGYLADQGLDPGSA
jgi:hypothetical protein